MKKVLVSLFLLCALCLFKNSACSASDYLFIGEVGNDGVNVRADSTVTAPVICSVEKGERIEVVKELYDWYKVRLPAHAPSYIKKSFVKMPEAAEVTNSTLAENSNPQTANTKTTVTATSVNIRSTPDTTGLILGKVTKDDSVIVVEDKGEWLKIQPAKTCYGYMHKTLLSKITEKPKETVDDKIQRVTIVGLLRAKTFKRVATHKIADENDNVYLLKGDKEKMDTFNNRKVKISGRIIDAFRQDPLVFVEKVEASD